MTTLKDYIDQLIPPQYKENDDQLTKCYVLLGVLLSNLIFSFIGIILLSFFLPLEEAPKFLALSIVSATFVGYSATLIAFKVTKSLEIASRCFLLVLVITVYPPVFITGGYQESPIVQMYMLVPITAFLLSGMWGGLLWTVFTIICCLSLALLSELNILNIQMVSNEKIIELLRVGLNVTIFCMVAGVLSVYEIINENLKQKLRDEKSEFEHEANHDALTAIPNRNEFSRRLDIGLKECEARHQKLALAYLDLDGFKPVNDQYGHHVGDELLKTIAKRLQDTLRLSDTVARLGGDEFALILAGINFEADINLVIQKVIQTIEEPMDIDGHRIQVFASIGVSIFPEHSTDAKELCKQADEAMYRAKEKEDHFEYYRVLGSTCL